MNTLLLALLNKIPLNGNKTALGVFSIIVYAVIVFLPQYKDLVLEAIGWLGFVLTPVGLVHKAAKNNSGSSY
jgi:hypothetical protein